MKWYIFFFMNMTIELSLLVFRLLFIYFFANGPEPWVQVGVIWLVVMQSTDTHSLPIDQM